MMYTTNSERKQAIEQRIRGEQENVVAYQNVVSMALQEIADSERRMAWGRLSLVAEKLLQDHPTAHCIVFKKSFFGSSGVGVECSVFDSQNRYMTDIDVDYLRTELLEVITLQGVNFLLDQEHDLRKVASLPIRNA